MRYLCYGGSFNPVHLGHLIASRAACEQKGLDRVLLIPCADPPHKTSLAPFTIRMRMIEAAIQPKLVEQNFGIPRRFDVSDIEQIKGGKSYTIDTVRALKEQGHTDVHWLIGGDTVNLLPTWHKIEELVQECAFVITERPGFVIDWDILPDYLKPLKANVVDVPLLNISATSIRQRVGYRQSLRYLVSDDVAAIIGFARLYL